MSQPDQLARPRLRQDVAFLQTLEGVYVRGHDGAFVIRGAGAYQYLSALLPHLDGGSTMAEIVAGLPDAHASAVRNLLGTLARRGVVLDGPDPRSALDPETRTKYAGQLALLDHYGDDGTGFARAAQARVLVVGADQQATATLAAALTANGVGSTGSVRQATTVDPAELLATTAGPALDLICLVTLDGPDPALFELADAARAAGVKFVPLLRVGDRFVCGPLQADGASVRSALLRMSDNAVPGVEAIWQAAVAGRSAVPALSALPGTATSLAVNLAGFELFKVLTGRIDGDLDGRVIVIDPLRLTARTEPLVAHPAVPADAVRHPAGEGGEVRSEVEAAYRLYDSVVADHVGIFRRFDDDAMPQIPVKTAVLLAPRPVVRFGVETVLEARLAALEEAAAEYAVAAARRTGSLPEATTAAETIASDRLEGRLGSGPVRSRLVAAADYATGRPLAVEQAAVLAGPADRNAAEFEPATTGVRAAPTLAEARRRGLFEIAAIAATASVVRAEVGLQEVGDELLAEVLAAAEEGPRLTMLLRELTDEGCQVRLFHADAALPVAVAVVREGGRDLRTARAAASWPLALEELLLELVGRRQIAGTPYADLRPALVDDLDAALLGGAAAGAGQLTRSVDEETVLAVLAERGYAVAVAELTPPDLAGVTAVARCLLFRSSTDLEESR